MSCPTDNLSASDADAGSLSVRTEGPVTSRAFYRGPARRALSLGVVMEFLVLVYFAGIVVAVFVMRARAGAGIWHRLKIFGHDGFGLGWALTISAAAMVWPITLVKWLATGKPAPRTLFNEKAEAARRAQSGGF